LNKNARVIEGLCLTPAISWQEQVTFI